MVRLTVLFHDDTREPVAVQEMRQIQAVHLATDSHAGVNPAGGIYGRGPEAEACKALLLRERAHWMAEKAGGAK